jgi:hypothetical protein
LAGQTQMALPSSRLTKTRGCSRNDWVSPLNLPSRPPSTNRRAISTWKAYAGREVVHLRRARGRVVGVATRPRRATVPSGTTAATSTLPRPSGNSGTPSTTLQTSNRNR